MKKRLIILTAALGLLSLLVYLVLLPSQTNTVQAALAGYQNFPNLKKGDRVTIVSPHLDDETLGVAGLIREARRENIPVSVIFMTNGDDFPLAAEYEFKTGYPTPPQLIQSGEERQNEALAALSKLGVASNSVYFLGLPDRGLLTLYQSTGDRLYTAPGTQVSHNPYPRAYILNLAYSHNATLSALQQAITQTHPTVLITTLPDDRHTDHRAAALFVQQVKSQSAPNSHLYYFLVHYPHFPNPRGINSKLPLLPPKKLANRPWQVVFLDADALTHKQDALNEYKSQLRIPLLGRLMRSLVRQNELLLSQ